MRSMAVLSNWGRVQAKVMIPADEAHLTLEFEDYYLIQPAFHWWTAENDYRDLGGTPCPDGFSYSSDGNDLLLGEQEINEMLETYRRELDLD